MSCDHATVGAMSESPTVPDVLNGPADRAEFRRSPHRAGVELYRAHIVQHAFEPHSHAAYGLGAIEAGAERFRYRGSEHVAPAASLVLMNPHELHTDRAIDLMRARLGEPLTLAELAAAAQLSPFHFLRRFKSRHHATPQQMLMALRLLDAKRRLARGERPADVAAAVGLADQAHLNRAFVRRYGVAPGRYRRQVAPAAALRAA
jgi:AraC-like DNA-binding protein